MSVLLITSSPDESSRSTALLEAAALKIVKTGADIQRLNVAKLAPAALLLADFNHREIVQAIQMVEQARVVLIATPIYKAAYSGLLKVFLDVLPQFALKEKIILPIATGGSPHHMLALADKVLLIENGQIRLNQAIAIARLRKRSDVTFIGYEKTILDTILHPENEAVNTKFVEQSAA